MNASMAALKGKHKIEKGCNKQNPVEKKVHVTFGINGCYIWCVTPLKLIIRDLVFAF